MSEKNPKSQCPDCGIEELSDIAIQAHRDCAEHECEYAADLRRKLAEAQAAREKAEAACARLTAAIRAQAQGEGPGLQWLFRLAEKSNPGQALLDELAELQAFKAKVGKVAVCCGCGAEMPRNTEAELQAMTDHIMSCKTHPIHKVLDALAAKDAEIARLRAIVERLPKTADGVTVTGGDLVYLPIEGPSVIEMVVAYGVCNDTLNKRAGGGWSALSHFAGLVNDANMADVDCCYSTRAAAEAAKEKDHE